MHDNKITEMSETAHSHTNTFLPTHNRSNVGFKVLLKDTLAYDCRSWDQTLDCSIERQPHYYWATAILSYPKRIA